MLTKFAKPLVHEIKPNLFKKNSYQYKEIVMHKRRKSILSAIFDELNSIPPYVFTYHGKSSTQQQMHHTVKNQTYR